MVKDIDNLWFTFGDMASQKKFAQKVKDHKFSSILFSMRKELKWGEQSEEKYIRNKLLDNAKRAAEIMFGRKTFQFDKE